MAKILLVDDSRVQRNWAKKALANSSYGFIEAENGLVALDKMEEHQPDLVICDLNMPIMGGIECMETMRTRGLSFPFVVITADIQDSTKDRCVELGALSIIHKPFKGPDLVALVEDIFSLQEGGVAS